MNFFYKPEVSAVCQAVCLHGPNSELIYKSEVSADTAWWHYRNLWFVKIHCSWFARLRYVLGLCVTWLWIFWHTFWYKLHCCSLCGWWTPWELLLKTELFSKFSTICCRHFFYVTLRLPQVLIHRFLRVSKACVQIWEKLKEKWRNTNKSNPQC